jgi:hypothetical protein
LGLGYGHHDQVLEHLDIGGTHDRLVELDLPDVALAIGFDRDHPTPRRPGHRHLGELLLECLHLALNLLRLLKDLEDVGHDKRRRL